MIRRISGVPAVLALVCCAGSMSAQVPPSGSGAASPATGTRPTLVVLITVDQLRAAYLDRFGPQLNGGIGRVMRGGAWFTYTHHDHPITQTAPRPAPLPARRVPLSSGLMLNTPCVVAGPA